MKSAQNWSARSAYHRPADQRSPLCPKPVRPRAPTADEHTHTHTHTNAHAHIYSNVYIKKEKMPKGQGTHTWPFELHNSTPQHTNSLTKEFTYHICIS